MSGNNYTCREKYYNYGSYLRSRGYDHEICNLVAAIEKGSLKIGPLVPGDCASNTHTTINNSVRINPCENDISNNTGILVITGGNDSSNPSLQAMNGASVIGDLTVRGDLNVTGYVKDLSAVSIYESLEIDSMTGFSGESFAIYHSNTARGNLEALWSDSSNNTNTPSAWENKLVYAIDGRHNSLNNADGSTDQIGHVRGLRGATFMNPPNPSQPIDVSYNKNIAGSDVALDIYGGLYINEGNNGAGALLDISGGEFSIYNGSTEVVNFDSSGNGTLTGSFNAANLDISAHASIYDLSVVNLMTVGVGTTYINSNEISANTITVDDLILSNDLTVSNNLSVENNLTVSKNILFNNAEPHQISFNTGGSNTGSILNNGDLDIRTTSAGSIVISPVGDLYLESGTNQSTYFNKNPIVQRTTNENFTNFGTAQTVMLMTPEHSTIGNGNTTTLLNFPSYTTQQQRFYSNYPANTFADSGPDISMNSFFENCIVEFCISAECIFSSNSESLRCVLLNDNSANTLTIDTRSISKNTSERVVFGPISYYTTSLIGDIDITKKLKIQLELVGTTGNIDISNVRLTMNTTNIA